MPDKVVCPKCGCDQITADKKGVNVKGAVLGALALGPFGLAFGALGRNKITVTCLGCGYSWPAGHPEQGVDSNKPQPLWPPKTWPLFQNKAGNLSELHQQREDELKRQQEKTAP